MTGIKVFSVKTGRGNYAVERINDELHRDRFRLMHDRRYITAEIFWTEDQAIEAMLEHLKRVFIKQLTIDGYQQPY